MALLLAVLEAFYGHAPLRVGDAAIVTAQVSTMARLFALEGAPGIAVETPAGPRACRTSGELAHPPAARLHRRTANRARRSCRYARASPPVTACTIFPSAAARSPVCSFTLPSRRYPTARSNGSRSGTPATDPASALAHLVLRHLGRNRTRPAPPLRRSVLKFASIA